MNRFRFSSSIIVILFAGIALLIAIADAHAGRRRGSVTTECNNGTDDDQDGRIDYPSDPGCYGLLDTTEGGDDVGCCQMINPDSEDQLFDNSPEWACQNAPNYGFYHDKTCREVRYLTHPRSCVGYACGEKTALVILVEFQGTTVQFPENSVFRGILAEVSSHYQENSFGQVWLTGVDNPNDSADIFGKYYIPYSTNCQDMLDQTRPILDDIIDQADPDIDFNNNYDTIFIVLSTGTNPYPNCNLLTGFQSYATIYTEEGIFRPGVEYIFLESTNGQNFRGYVHELGHHFFLGHADLLVCPGGSIDDPNCNVVEYFDAFDVMGVNIYGFHFNAIHKERLDWFYPSNVVEVTESGQYTIYPIELSTTDPQVIKLPRASNDYFYFEYRQPIGYDSFLADGYEQGLALIHLSNIDGWFGLNWRGDSILTPTFLDRVGASFVDPFWGHEISVAAMSPDSITLDIEFGAPPQAPPQVQLTFEDAHQHGPSYSPDGTKILYTSRED